MKQLSVWIVLGLFFVGTLAYAVECKEAKEEKCAGTEAVECGDAKEGKCTCSCKDAVECKDAKEGKCTCSCKDAVECKDAKGEKCTCSCTKSTKLEGIRVAVMIAEGFHDGETLKPMKYLEKKAADVTVIGNEKGELTAYNSEKKVAVEKTFGEISVEDFDALIIPGGLSPANLRQNEAAVQFAKDFFNSGKPVAAICHGPQVLVTAGVLEGLKATSVAGIADELREAGADYVDEAVVRDRNLITSRNPDDLPEFSEAIAKALKKK